MLPFMLIYAGIDEAGYGPMLGPLCVGCTAFVIPDHDPEKGKIDLWKRLQRVVCKKKTDKRRRIAINDSKLLKGSNSGKTHPLLHLERGVLACLAEGDQYPRFDQELFDRLGTTLPPQAWYDSSTALPVANHPDQLRIASARLQNTFGQEGVELGYRGCEVIDVESFNRQVDRTGSKATVNFSAAMQHVDRIWKQWPVEHPRVIIDRHGGRTHYREHLQSSFPEAHIRIIAEEETISRYRLERDGSALTVSFHTEAEKGHLPVALASMIAKYVRELAMIRLNRYFRSILPELKPTAGYVQDARRYLGEIESVIQDRKIDRRGLVRNC